MLSKKCFLFFILIISSFSSPAFAEKERPNSGQRTFAKWLYLGLAPVWGYVDGRHVKVTNNACGFRPLRCTGYHEALIDSAQFASSKAYMLDDLTRLAKDPEAIRILKKINTMASDEGHKFNLWTVTLREYQGDKRKAMQFLAAFFQDTAANNDLPIAPNTNKLMQETFQKVVKGMNNNVIQGYPPNVPSNKTGIYHFYAIGEIAAKMRDKDVPIQCAATMPYIINEMYEKPFNGHSKGVFDIYTGYAGASFALSNDQKSFTGASYETFRANYNKDGGSAVGNFFKNDLGQGGYCKNDPGAIPKEKSTTQSMDSIESIIQKDSQPDELGDFIKQLESQSVE